VVPSIPLLTTKISYTLLISPVDAAWCQLSVEVSWTGDQ